jgi:hypothetical protein
VLCKNLECVEEKFIDRQKKVFVSHNDITDDPHLFDYYIGCWRKTS